MVAEGELDDVVADIVGPAGDEADEPPPVVGKQRPRGFLEAGEIAGHHGHEVIGSVARVASAICIAIGAAFVPAGRAKVETAKRTSEFTRMILTDKFIRVN